MTWVNSLAMICLAADQAECNRLMLACKRGPATFSVPIRDKTTLVRVAYGAHTYDDALADALVATALPVGVSLADLTANGFTATSARAAVAKIKFKVVANQQAVANIKARLDQEGWEIEPLPPMGT
jgi:hypothetical protein